MGGTARSLIDREKGVNFLLANVLDGSIPRLTVRTIVC